MRSAGLSARAQKRSCGPGGGLPPGRLLPSIHTASVDRITSQIRQPGERQISGQHSTQASHAPARSPSSAWEITASVLGSQTWTPSDAVRRFSASEPHRRSRPTHSGTAGVDAERLRRRMPLSLREGLLRRPDTADRSVRRRAVPRSLSRKGKSVDGNELDAVGSRASIKTARVVDCYADARGVAHQSCRPGWRGPPI